MEASMSADAWITLLVVLFSLTALVSNRFPPETVLVGALACLLLTGVLDTPQALAGFANPGLVTVAVLYVVVSGLVDTGAVQALGSRLLGKSRGTVNAQTRLMLPELDWRPRYCWGWWWQQPAGCRCWRQHCWPVVPCW